MQIISIIAAVMLVISISGCSTTQEPPTSLENYSKVVNAGFVSFKRGGMRHRAFAVGKYGKRDFFGYAHRYETVKKAEEQALSQCYKHAGAVKDRVTCFVYFSE